MTMNLNDKDITTTISSASDSLHRAPTRNIKRQKPARRFFKRRWLKKLRPKRFLRTSAVLFVLAMFVYVSKTNNVMGPSGYGSALQNAARSGLTDILTRVNKEVMSPNTNLNRDPAPDTGNESATRSSTAASALGKGEGSSAQVPDAAKLTADTQTIYVVPEGSSLWRTGIQFIDDTLLLDNLIDNLAERGVKVRNVGAGTYFIVNKLGREGLLVVIEADGNTYESHVYEDHVVTSSQPASNS